MWMDVGNTVLSERSQAQRTNSVRSHLQEAPRTGKFTVRKLSRGYRAWGGGQRGSYFSLGTEFLLEILEKF